MINKEETTPLSAEEVLIAALLEKELICEALMHLYSSNNDYLKWKTDPFSQKEIPKKMEAILSLYHKVRESTSQPSPQVEDRMKWVKASDKTSTHYERVCCRINGSTYYFTAYYDFHKDAYIGIDNSTLREVSEIEWLEEPLSTLTSIK